VTLFKVSQTKLWETYCIHITAVKYLDEVNRYLLNAQREKNLGVIQLLSSFLHNSLCPNKKAVNFVSDFSKGKTVNVSCPCVSLIEHHAMKVYCGSGGIAPHMLDLGY
jgi:hypothetical protein